MSGPTVRYREIDLFRAIAILLVVGFHYLSRWTPPRHTENLYPYGQTFAEFPLFSSGNLGVEFFFMISGFVIALTLEGCRHPLEFCQRRAARLLPAMIVCSLLTLFVIRVLLPVQPFLAHATVWNLLPSWTFTDPFLWSKVLPVNAHIDGAYWSLVIELQFYFWAALIYFMKKEHFSRNLFLFCALATIAHLISTRYNIISVQRLDYYVFSGRHAMLFAAGVIFYQIYKDRSALRRFAPLLGICLALEFAVALLHSTPLARYEPKCAMMLVFYFAFLAVALGWQAPRKAWSEALVKIGLASYPLYLLHQFIGVAILKQGVGLQSKIAIFALFIAVCAGLIALSLIIHKTVELPGKRLILTLLRADGRARHKIKGAV